MKRGFTLIELLVVVLIIGILSAVALPKYTIAVEKARAATILPLLKSLASAKLVYFSANQTHARSFAELDIDLPANCQTAVTNDHYGETSVCDKWIVKIDANHNYVQAESTLGDKSHIVLEISPTSGKRWCGWNGENKIAEKVCRSFGITENCTTIDAFSYCEMK